MEPKINKQNSDKNSSSYKDVHNPEGGIAVSEKVGTAHLTGRISELSVFGLLWG
ncbi:hypothetical protein LS482_12415 [Sinomicrobium kalidii]|uniref:hypothetical protein n=1 Tax=Sinomicrobium kalidii TaxID=2900738 RepID=UPI001E44F176|nr:hypothetical protein [Sinomicrobium kalidii]UGU14500.1 hypothetical protein LS482_12415 [Sinomicrobium kalidii]